MRSFSVKNIYAGKKKRNYLFCTRYNSILNPERKILIIKVGLAATAKWHYKLYCQWLFRLSFFLELNLVVLTRRICHTTMLSLGVAWRKTVSDKKCRNKRDLSSKGLAPLSSPRKNFFFFSHFSRQRPPAVKGILFFEQLSSRLSSVNNFAKNVVILKDFLSFVTNITSK